MADLGPKDSFFSAGLLFKRLNLGKLGRHKTKSGFKFVIHIHDLVPIKFPHLAYHDHLGLFRKYYSDAIQIADVVTVYSETTLKDVEEYSKAKLYLESVEIRHVGLGLDHLRVGRESHPLFDSLIAQPFILFVSTVERRKNHDVLYRAYELAAREGNAELLPTLIVVGSEGWGAASVIHDLKHDPALTDRNGRRLVVFMDGVEDEKLSWLYRNAHFSVYPSLYEGWGLPVSESLLFGTHVLVSDRGSLMESSFGLATEVPALDARLWAEEILRFAAGPKIHVDNNIKVGTWKSMGEKISTAMER
jgi:glycosyltransferase involved in cell wall biosynthesis